MEICDGFAVEDKLDKDGDLEFEIECHGVGPDSRWINKDQAKALIAHLTEVFELNNED